MQTSDIGNYLKSLTHVEELEWVLLLLLLLLHCLEVDSPSVDKGTGVEVATADRITTSSSDETITGTAY